MRDFLLDVIIPFVVLVIITIAIVIVPAYFLSESSCKNKAELLDMEYKWSFTTACFVERNDGKFIPLESIKGNEF